MTLSVLMTTEGTYPYSAGGVSTWCDALLRNTPDLRWTLLPLMMNPHIEQKFDPPANVRKILGVPLWGIEEPAEFITDIPFAQLYDRKRRTTAADGGSASGWAPAQPSRTARSNASHMARWVMVMW